MPVEKNVMRKGKEDCININGIINGKKYSDTYTNTLKANIFYYPFLYVEYENNQKDRGENKKLGLVINFNYKNLILILLLIKTIFILII